jgi:hypothetical protein
MPTNQLQIPPVSGFRLAMSFDITGNDIVASGFANESCTPQTSAPIVDISSSFNALAKGAVAADGSFSVQSLVGFPGTSISIQGNTPKTNEKQFSGTYSASLNSPIGTGCAGSFSGPFIATSFPLVSGVYAGTGTTQTITDGVSKATPVAIQVSLQQGATLTNPTTGASRSSSLALTGSIRVQGSPCFTSGATNATLPSSSVEGNLVFLNFTMDDGSTVVLSGALIDASEAHISTEFLVVTAGKCGTVPSFYQISGLDRQVAAN